MQVKICKLLIRVLQQLKDEAQCSSGCFPTIAMSKQGLKQRPTLCVHYLSRILST